MIPETLEVPYKFLYCNAGKVQENLSCMRLLMSKILVQIFMIRIQNDLD